MGRCANKAWETTPVFAEIEVLDDKRWRIGDSFSVQYLSNAALQCTHAAATLLIGSAFSQRDGLGHLAPILARWPTDISREKNEKTEGEKDEEENGEEDDEEEL